MLVHPGEVVRRHGEQGVASPDAPLLVVFGDEGLDVPAVLGIGRLRRARIAGSILVASVVRVGTAMVSASAWASCSFVDGGSFGLTHKAFGSVVPGRLRQRLQVTPSRHFMGIGFAGTEPITSSVGQSSGLELTHRPQAVAYV